MYSRLGAFSLRMKVVSGETVVLALRILTSASPPSPLGTFGPLGIVYVAPGTMVFVPSASGFAVAMTWTRSSLALTLRGEPPLTVHPVSAAGDALVPAQVMIDFD